MVDSFSELVSYHNLQQSSVSKEEEEEEEEPDVLQVAVVEQNPGDHVEYKILDVGVCTFGIADGNSGPHVAMLRVWNRHGRVSVKP